MGSNYRELKAVKSSIEEGKNSWLNDRADNDQTLSEALRGMCWQVLSGFLKLVSQHGCICMQTTCVCMWPLALTLVTFGEKLSLHVLCWSSTEIPQWIFSESHFLFIDHVQYVTFYFFMSWHNEWKESDDHAMVLLKVSSCFSTIVACSGVRLWVSAWRYRWYIYAVHFPCLMLALIQQSSKSAGEHSAFARVPLFWCALVVDWALTRRLEVILTMDAVGKYYILMSTVLQRCLNLTFFVRGRWLFFIVLDTVFSQHHLYIYFKSNWEQHL